MKKKIDVLRELAAAGKWEDAIKLAGTFPRLGEEEKAIKQAREAFLRPAFQIQLGRDPKMLITTGVTVLRAKYHL